VVSSWEVGGGQVDRVGRASRLLPGRDRRRRPRALGGRIATTPEQLELFTRSVAPTDRVVLEATGNAFAIARILEPHVAEVVLAHAKQFRAISRARIKTDKVDAKVLADLLAADLIPAVWIGDERARMLRRLVRAHLDPPRGTPPRDSPRTRHGAGPGVRPRTRRLTRFR
jgi:transposase